MDDLELAPDGGDPSRVLLVASSASAMPDFTPSEQSILDDLVRRRTTSFKRPAWMQTHRAAAITAQARKQIAAKPAESAPGIRAGEKRYYNAAQRLRVRTARGKGKIHEAGPDGRPICPMHQEGRLDSEHLGPGPVTCGRCAAARAP